MITHNSSNLDGRKNNKSFIGQNVEVPTCKFQTGLGKKIGVFNRYFEK